MYEEKIAKYYDRMYEGKDYEGEVAFILEAYKHYVGGEPRQILDVGCGTGNHALMLAMRGYKVLGVDKAHAMIKRAGEKAKKCSDLSLDFRCCDLEEITESDFDMVISMFNVINHIEHLGTLLSFFKNINNRLRNNGLYVFDCWNGVAAIRSLPANKGSEIKSKDGTEFHIDSKAVTDLMKSKTRIENHISVRKDREIKNFTFIYEQTLWTPKTISDLLSMANFEISTICQLYDVKRSATPEDWKIAFVCKRLSPL